MRFQFLIRSFQTLCLALVLGAISPCALVSAQQQKRPNKPVKVILKVEAQGPGGLWMQAGKDLSSTELNQLRSLIIEGIEKLPNHKLVPLDDKDEDLGLAVVAEKLQCGQDTYILLSSALTIAKANGTDVFVSHDVIASTTLALAANAVVGILASVEFRAFTGLL
jgi:hypothetical protein